MSHREVNSAALRFRRRLTTVVVGFIVVMACVMVRHYWAVSRVHAEPQQASESAPLPANQAQTPPAAPNGSASTAKIVAVVNGEPISREELGNECLLHYGTQVLESLCNKYLIILECQRQNITVSPEEVNAEIERLAKNFKLPVTEWLKMLKQEKGINVAQYSNDIIWPTLALRKLAGSRLAITAEELQTEYETRYGEAVKGRIIVCNTKQKAERARAEAFGKPNDFGNLAKELSDDPSSASLKGMIQPIRMHSGNKEIEAVAFRLKDGEISEVLPIAGQFIVFQREGLIPPRQVAMKDAQPFLEEIVRERKMRGAANDIFRELQSRAKVENVMNDPKLSRELPGVAARINGSSLTIHELAERTIERHGEDVLEGTINRRILEQVVRQKKITISDADLNAEIARAAAAALRLKGDGSPDVETWVKMATQQQGISEAVYRRDTVWPSVALRKLAGNQVQITDEDLKKGYEANYGPRVRCRVIIMDSLKQAQKVWELAKRQPTVDNFGELAAKYSIETTTRALHGEVPPIQRHGGQPTLEKEAFELQKGEISGIVQLNGDQYVILFCEGRTVPPSNVDMASVRDILVEHIQQEKSRMAMSNYFQLLKDNATTDNFLTGASHAPKSTEKSQAAAPRKGSVR